MAYGAGGDEAEPCRDDPRGHIELGVTMFDTAELYGTAPAPTSSWSARRQGLSRRDRDRDQVRLRHERPDVRPPRQPAEHIREVAENSLRNLDTDNIDVLYQHRVDPDVPIEDVAGAVGRAGRGRQGPLLRPVRGGAGDDPPRARGAPGVGAADGVFGVRARGRAPGVAALEELGIGFVAYSPLGPRLPHRRRQAGRGVRRERHPQRSDPRWQPGNYERNVAAIEQFGRLAADKGVDRRRSWRSPGCSPSTTMLCRSPVPGASSAWRRTPAPPMSS